MITETLNILNFDDEEWVAADYRADASGAYFSDDNVIIIRDNVNDDEFEEILIHEITHMLNAFYPYIVYDLVNFFYKGIDNQMVFRTEFCEILIDNYSYPNNLETLHYEHDSYILQELYVLDEFLDIIEEYYGVRIILNFI